MNLTYIQWDDNFSVKIDEIDRQHKVLIDLINDTTRAIEEKKTRENLEEILDALLKYIEEHFSFEEAYLKKINYTNIEPHKLEHISFKKKITAFLAEFFAESKGIPQELNKFLVDWLINHIMISDKKIA